LDVWLKSSGFRKGIASSLIGLTLASSIAAAGLPRLSLPRVPTESPQRSATLHRDAPIRIAALRVEFVRDTLSTTSGDGGFAYDRSHSLFSSLDDTTVIHFDPPPHDSLYFADHLQFQHFYWDKMSGGAVSLQWDIFPAGERSAYRVPKQIWQYNYNNGDAQLDRGLAELFRDAIQAADADPALIWRNYDLVIIFHAGAGPEFDLGYTTTPHDIPSAWMISDDFRAQLNLPNGIPVDGGSGFVSSGIILPETETHEGVQISLAGVATLMIGHWLGLPALYDRDDGSAVVGKWSMMDRGFGNFYGALPSPVDAFSADRMGWLPVSDAAEDTTRIVARFHEGPEAAPFLPRSLRIPVTAQEEFILECRFRDPENDSVAYAYPRGGRRMTLKDDYSVEVEPGFRVPVRADDLDFDSPGSGILIWHHDRTLDHLIDKGYFNAEDELRGLDLEEADGAQDLGRDYPFLTAGYGTDYGIYEDAWFGDNSAHRDANGGRAVSFNNDSYPDSRANSGAFTHIKLDRFSRRGGVMTFLYNNSLIKHKHPIAFDPVMPPLLAVGNCDDDPDDEEYAIISDLVKIYDGYGELLHVIPQSNKPIWLRNDPSPVVRDLGGDGLDEIAYLSGDPARVSPAAYCQLAVIRSAPLTGYEALRLPPFYHEGLGADFGWLLGVGGSGVRSKLVIALAFPGATILREYNSALDLTDELTLNFSVISAHRVGSASSDSVLLVDESSGVHLWSNSRLTTMGNLLPNGYYRSFTDPVIADFDGSGDADLLCYTLAPELKITLVKDILTNGLTEATSSDALNDLAYAKPLIPLDFDADGRMEFVGGRGNEFWMVESNAVRGEDAPLLPFGGGSDRASIGPISPEGPTLPSIFPPPLSIADLDDDGRSDNLFSDRVRIPFDAVDYEGGGAEDKTFLRAFNHQGISLPGFPIAFDNIQSFRLIQPDSTGRLMLLAMSDESVALLDPGFQGSREGVWSEGPYRDRDNSNAVWEPATPFLPNPSAPLMPSDLCYNWPNPARGESTAIRYTLNYPARITVNIFDVAGDPVTTLYGEGQEGLPGEILWNLKDVARGGYLAVVKAEGLGRSESKVVKIAVMK